MPLRFSLFPGGDVPLYRQIVQQVNRAVAAGELQVGEQVPAVRVLAETLLINPNTIARAYQELIREGVLESRLGVGVFVAERRQILSDDEREIRLRRAIDQLFHEVVLLDFRLPQVVATLRERWDELHQVSAATQQARARRKS